MKPSETFTTYGALDFGRALSTHFHFDIPLFFPLAEELRNHQVVDASQPLPSSLCAVAQPTENSCCRGDCVVSYRVRAEMNGAGVAVAESARSIDIFPTLEPRPPLWIEDFPGEYSALNMKRLRGFFALRHVGDLSIQATEPRPFEFVRSRGGASSAVRLKLSYRQIRNQEMEPPVIAQGQMASRLKAATFISVVAQHTAPTLHQATVSPFLTRTLKACGREQHHTFKFSPWRCASGEPSSSGKVQISFYAYVS